MSNEQIRKIIEDTYDDSKEETLRTIAGDFYNRKMLSIALLVWGWALVFIALAVYSAMRFFKADQTQGQIMYAALFVLGAHGVGLMKIRAGNVRRDLAKVEDYPGGVLRVGI